MAALGWQALSFDVEHWYDATLVTEPGPHARPEYAEREADWVLAFLAEHDARATFFVLGRLASELPALVRRVADAGHEIACHGWSHALAGELGPEAFGRAARDGRALLQDLSGQEVRGYRAATWSIGPATTWASEALVAAGFAYDSSVFPMRTPLYGVPGAPRRPYRIATAAGEIVELPPAVARFGPLAVPLAGGIYWQVVPLAVVRYGLRRLGAPGVLYAHPWGIAPAGWTLPRQTPLGVRLAMVGGIGRSRRVLRALVEAAPVRPLGELEAVSRAGGLATYRWQGGRLVAQGPPLGEGQSGGRVMPPGTPL